MDLLAAAFTYLCAAVIAVPVAKKLGLGSVLGYLLAGVTIGPLIGFVGSETAEIQHFAEFGVVMMLFLVGLELQPAMLWRMKTQLLGLGGMQMVLTTLSIGGIGIFFGLHWQAALAVGMILALSSTAIVLQTLNEKGWMGTQGGQSSFSILLTQDIAVIPMLALLPLLAIHDSPVLSELAVSLSNALHFEGELLTAAHAAAPADPNADPTAFQQLPPWGQGGVILAVILGIIFGGKFMIRPIFRAIAESKLREIFTAAALLLVIGIALLMNYVGLSPALGTFLAGVVLSDSEYRHELESDIEPFKGLLLGLFFITVGAGVDFDLLFDNPGQLVGMAIGLIAIKAAILFTLGTVFGLKGADRLLLTLGLAQAGEFAFVLFGFALSAHVLDPSLIKPMTLVVALTMILTPGLFILYEKVLAPRSVKDSAEDDTPPSIEEKGTVVVAGIGRVGQIVTRLLMTNGYTVTVLDHDPDTIERLSRVGFRAYYGDATRPDLLHAAGLDHAQLFIAALDDREKQTHMIEHVAKTFPHVKIYARAHDRHHIYELENAGAHYIERETFEGALNLGRSAMIGLGQHPFKAEIARRKFRQYDKDTIDILRNEWNTAGVSSSYIDTLRAQGDMLNELMASDRASLHDSTETGWTPPPKSFRVDS